MKPNPNAPTSSAVPRGSIQSGSLKKRWLPRLSLSVIILTLLGSLQAQAQWTITTQPQDQIVNTNWNEEGENSRVFSCTIADGSGSPPLVAVQWKKNNTLLPGQQIVAGTASLTVERPYSRFSLGDHALYRAVFRHPQTGALIAESDPAQLVVVDGTQKVITASLGSSASTSINYAALPGTQLTFEWARAYPNEALQPEDFTGINAQTLTMNSVTGPNWFSVYCTVSLDENRQTQTDYHSFYAVAVPEIQITSLPNGYRGSNYQQNLVMSGSWEAVDTWEASGLPAGLVIEQYNFDEPAQIRGIPTVTGTFQVTITATNGAGSHDVTLPLQILATPPAVAGRYAGILERDPTYFPNGGTFQFKINNKGSASGTMQVNDQSFKIKAPVDVSSDIENEVHRITLNFGNKFLPFTRLRLSLYGTGAIGGILFLPTSGEGNSWSEDEYNDTVILVKGWKSLVDTPGASLTTTPADRFNMAFAYSDNSELKQSPTGYSFGTARVKSNGVVTVAGRLADGQPFTSSGVLGEQGQFRVFRNLYAKNTRGSILGDLTLNQTTGVLSIGSQQALTWRKPNQLRKEALGIYSSGFRVVNVMPWGQEIEETVLRNPTFVGAKYQPPTSAQRFLNAPNPGAGNGNAGLSLLPIPLEAPDEDGELPFPLTSANSSDNPSLDGQDNRPLITLGFGSAVTLPAINPAGVKLKVKRSTGAFSGQFTHKTLMGNLIHSRNAKFRGLAVGGEAYGYYLMKTLPTNVRWDSLGNHRSESAPVLLTPVN